MAETPKLQDIQVLRAVACLMVMVQHSTLGAQIFTALPGNLTMPFYLGVQLFFVISGYVVTNSLFRGDMRPVAFLIRRFFRLVPAISVFLLFSAVVFVASQAGAQKPTSPDQFTAQAVAIFFGTLTFHSGVLSVFGHMWSLSIEYQFYFAFALLALVLVVARFGRQAIRSMFFIVAVTILAICFITSWAMLVSPESRKHEPAVLTYLVNWSAYFLLLGVVLALLPERVNSYLRRLAPWRAPLALAALVAALAMVAVAGSPLDASSVRIRVGLVAPLVGLLFTLAVALAAMGTGENRGRLYRLMIWVGDRSYSLYLFHLPVVVLIGALVTAFYPTLWYINPIYFYWTQFIAIFALSVPLAALTFTHVEQPGNALGKYMARRPKVAA
jgi:peptidoglycan/LPS O-acetylase OafA/YrhL